MAANTRAGADVFAPANNEQVLRLVREHPLAWVISTDGGNFHATPLPLRPRVGNDGRIEAFDGHLARRNPHCAAMQRDPRVLVLFSGPQGYISPSWVSNRTWAPTWNYAIAQYLCDIRFDENPARLEAVLDDLIGAMERGRPNAWSRAEMGERYERIRGAIVPFDATVVEARVKFKLGQDERDAIFAEHCAGLERAGSGELLAWMRELNPGR